MQKWILKAALVNAQLAVEPTIETSQGGGRAHTRVDLFVRDIMTDYFGFGTRPVGYPAFGDYAIDIEENERSRYHSAHSSVSRTLRRLYERELITYRCGSWNGLVSIV